MTRQRPTTRSTADAGRPGDLPAFVAPELATLVDTVPGGDDWLHEIKLDGYRILCRIEKGAVRFLTRQAQDWTAFFPRAATAASKLNARRAMLDGELVALDASGKPEFQRLQNAVKNPAGATVVYYVFDLLYLDGRDLTGLPLSRRKEMLRELIQGRTDGLDGGPLRYSHEWSGDGRLLYEESCRKGFEGIISKRADSPYRSERTRDWLKIKCIQRQEFVIGGFTEPAGARTHLGALLVGVYDGRGNLHYAGRVGTGFTQESLRALLVRLEPLVRSTPPFVDAPRGYSAKGVHWVEPALVAEVAFTEWTEDKLLRHPSFQGLREDKAPAGIRHEKAARTSASAKGPAGARRMRGAGRSR